MSSLEEASKGESRSRRKVQAEKKKKKKEGHKGPKAHKRKVHSANEKPAIEGSPRRVEKSPDRKKKRKKKSRQNTVEGLPEKTAEGMGGEKAVKPKKKRARRPSSEGHNGPKERHGGRRSHKPSLEITTDGESPTPPQSKMAKEEEIVQKARLVFKHVPPLVSQFYARFAKDESGFNDDAHWSSETAFMGLQPNPELLKNGPVTGLAKPTADKVTDMKVQTPGAKERPLSEVVAEMQEHVDETEKKETPKKTKTLGLRVEKVTASADKPKKSKDKKKKKKVSAELEPPNPTSNLTSDEKPKKPKDKKKKKKKESVDSKAPTPEPDEKPKKPKGKKKEKKVAADPKPPNPTIADTE